MTLLKKGHLTTEAQRTRRKFDIGFKKFILHVKKLIFQGQV